MEANKHKLTTFTENLQGGDGNYPASKCCFLFQVSVANSNWHLQNITCHLSGKDSALERQITTKTFRNRSAGLMESNKTMHVLTATTKQ